METAAPKLEKETVYEMRQLVFSLAMSSIPNIADLLHAENDDQGNWTGALAQLDSIAEKIKDIVSRPDAIDVLVEGGYYDHWWD